MGRFCVVKKHGEDSALIQRCFVAETMTERLVGLLGRSHLDADEGLLLAPCNQVHTFFMRFPIDIVALGANNEIIACKSLKPWRLSPLYFKAKKILELPLGHNSRLGLKPGQKLEFI